MYVGSNLALHDTGNMTPDKLIAFLIVFSQIIQPAKNITTAWFAIQKGMASIDRIDQVLDAEEKIVEKENAIAVNSFNESIEFKGVWYAYGNEPVLKDINLKITERSDRSNRRKVRCRKINSCRSSSTLHGR